MNLKAGLSICSLCCFVFLYSGTAKADKELSMEDLKSLSTQNNRRELIEKADQVKPAQRTAEWKKLILDSAVQELNGLANAAPDSNAQEGVASIILVAERKYEFLKNEKSYTQAKGQALVKVVEYCQDKTYSYCGTFIEQLSAGVDKFPKGVAKKIALMLSDERQPSETVRFWALAAEEDKKVCTHGLLQSAVISALKSDAGPRVAFAQKAAGTCYTELDQELTRQLSAAKKSDPFIKNACPVMLSHGTQTIAKKKMCNN